MRKVLKGIVMVFFAAGLQQAVSQNPNNSLLYSNQATLFGQKVNAGDPISANLPGTAHYAGFGSFIDNPASAALGNQSFFQFGLSHRNVEEDALYLGQNRISDATGNGVTSIGFVYDYPTVRGSLVIGAGYSQSNIFNRTIEFRGRNDNSSITDAFKADGSPYQEIAFNTFATDFGDEFEDWDESIFRVGFDQPGDFLGITQQGSVNLSGVSGEYSLFFATEVQKDLFIGASAGLLSGTFRFNRVFQESDEANLYNSTIIDSNSDGLGNTDVDNLLLDENLKSTFNGFRARAGMLYKLSEKINIGASYTFPTIIEVDEVFDVNLRNTFDNGDQFEDFTDSEFTYKIKSPSIVSVGAGVQNLSGLSLSVSADFTDYSNTSVDFIDSEFFEDELAENDFIADNFVSVWSFRGGASYDFSENFSLQAGYGYIPSRFRGGGDDQNIYSGGAGFKLTENIRFEVAAQLMQWDETSSVYDYVNYDYSPLPDDIPNTRFRSQEANRSVDRLQLFGTLKFRM